MLCLCRAYLLPVHGCSQISSIPYAINFTCFIASDGVINYQAKPYTQAMGATQEKSASEKLKTNTSVKPKGPSLTSIRRNKALSTDGHTARFLYQMLKQLDLKPIDWQEIADETGIPKGHAARMRYNRFKGQMEALINTEKALTAKLEDTDEDEPTVKRKAAENSSDNSEVQHVFAGEREDMNKRIKLENGIDLFEETLLQPALSPRIKTERDICRVTTPFVKPEPTDDSDDDVSVIRSSTIKCPTPIKAEDDFATEISHNSTKLMGSINSAYPQMPYMNPWSSSNPAHYYVPTRYAPHPLYHDMSQPYGHPYTMQYRSSDVPPGTQALHHSSALTLRSSDDSNAMKCIKRTASPNPSTQLRLSLSTSRRYSNRSNEGIVAADATTACEKD